MKSRSRLTQLASLVAGVALVLSLAACSGGGGTPNPKRSGDANLRMSAGATGPFTEQFNPLLQASVSAAGYSGLLIYEPLMLVDYRNSSTSPWLAKKATWNADGTKLTIDLRDDVTWSDGTAFTADDVAYTFELMMKNKALNFNGLPLSGAKAASRTQAVISFSQPAFQTLWYVTTPVQRKQWQAVSDPVTFANTAPIGTGPFTLTSFTPQVITLTRNAHYWGADTSTVGTVQYLSYDSESSMDAAVQGGQVDWIVAANTDPAQLTALSPKKLGSWSSPYGLSLYLMPSAVNGPTADVAVRRAISAAVDRDELSKLAFGAGATPVKNVTGLDGDVVSKLVAPQYKGKNVDNANASKAKSILEAAGYKLGGDGYFTTPKGEPLEISLTVPTNTPYGDWVRAATLIASQLKKAGIKITPKNESSASWRTDLALGNFELALRGAGGAGSVYDNLSRLVAQPVDPIGTQTVTNWVRYTNPDVGKQLDRMASSAMGSSGFNDAFHGLQDVLVKDVPVIPLAYPAASGVWRIDRFTGWPSGKDPYALPMANKPSVLDVVGRLTSP